MGRNGGGFWSVTWVLGIALALAGSSCEGSDGSPAAKADGGGVSPEASLNSVREACLRWCEKQAAAGCPGVPTAAECPERCDAIVPTLECGAEYARTGDCIAREARFGCLDDGKLEMYGCWAEFQPYLVCAACLPATSDDACDTCYKTQCCAERKAYYGHPDLGPYTDCTGNCVTQDGSLATQDGGLACLQDCAANFPNLAIAGNAMGECIGTCLGTCR